MSPWLYGAPVVLGGAVRCVTLPRLRIQGRGLGYGERFRPMARAPPPPPAGKAFRAATVARPVKARPSALAVSDRRAG